MCGGAFAQPIAITFVVVQELADVIKCTKFCGDRLRGFCATEGQSLGSPIGKRYGPYHSGKHYRAAVLNNNLVHCLLITLILDLSDFLCRLRHNYLRKNNDSLLLRQLSAVVDQYRFY
jgi:hypothetical protein